MVGTQQTTVEDRSGLSALFGAKGALASAGLDENGAFTEAMEEQLGGLLVELGIDPKTLEGMDVKAMLAKLQDLLQGQLTAAGGETLPLLNAAGLNQPDASGVNLLDASGIDLRDLDGRRLPGLAGLKLLDAGDLKFLEENAESSPATMSLAGLKLFLQANAEVLENVAENLGEEANAQAALAALFQQWLAGEDKGAKALVGDGEADSEDLSQLLAQLRQVLGAGQPENGALDERSSARLAQLRQVLGAGQPENGALDERSSARLAQLRQVLGAGQPENGALDERSSARLAQLRQVLGAGQPENGALDERSSARLAQLRQVLGAGQPENGALDERSSARLAQLRQVLGAGQPQDGTIDGSASRQFDFLIQALSQRGGAVDGAGTPAFHSSPIDGLALLKASLTANRGADQTSASAGADSPKAFDLTRLLTPDGARQMAERFAMIARARGGVAELKLHPPSLGTMEVRVSMDLDKAHVHFVSGNPAVRDVLEAAMPRLREALAQDGLSLGDASVSDQPPQRRDEADEGAGAEDGRGGTEAEGDELIASDGTTIPGSTLSALVRRLDLFA